MTSRPQDTTGAEMNRYWRQQQTAQQKPAIEARHDVIATDKPPVIHPDTPKPVPEAAPKIGNAVCLNCPSMKACRAMWKETHRKQHTAKPDVITATVRFVDEFAPMMDCLSGVRR